MTMQPRQINVLDFGAKGDGVTDDTAAIRAAFEAMRASMILTDQARPTDLCGAAHLRGTCPEVFFPNGLYPVSDAIDISGTFTSLSDRDMGAEAIRGESAIIKQTRPGTDIFVSRNSALTHVSGLKFVNGRHQLWLDNPNVGGFVKVIDCEFHGADGTAVIFGHHCFSTSVLLAQCLFRDCEQFVHTMTDVMMMRDLNLGGCHSHTGNNAGFDVRGGFVTFDNVMATPWSEGHDQRWIDNRAAILKLTGCRFGGEDGGILTVRNFMKYRTDLAYSNWIVIENCCIYNQTNLKRQAAIYCDEIPNRILVKNSLITGIPAIAVDPGIDLARYFEGVEPCALDYAVEHCSGVRGDLPELLKHPVVKPKTVAFLSREEVKARLDRAAAFVRNRDRKPAAPAPAMDAGHREQTDPATYMDISFGKYRWCLEGFADSELVPNEKYCVIAPVDDDVVIMKTTKDAGNAWTLIKDVTIDLDRYPYLTFRLKPSEFGLNYIGAVRIIERQSGDALLWSCGYAMESALYRAYNLRQFLGGGVKTVDIRLYAPGWRLMDARPDQALKTTACYVDRGWITATEAGEYTVIDFLRAEAE